MQEYKIRILDMQKEERPRERLIKNGAAALSDSELLAIILRTGSRQENVINLCQRILSQYNLKQLSQISPDQLMKIHGIKESKAAQIASCFEIARRLESFNEDAKPKINSPEDVYRRIYPRMREQKKENFIELCLDTKNQIIKEEIISIGSLNANIVHPREVFKAALAVSAAHIILAHNHPSGDPTPSREDIEITKKLIEAGKIIGIDVLDHVIIGDGRHFSMREAGHI
ncbi:DNA replication and repair protein RadC [Candidatus Methanoperedens nitroreducens]|uniref:DNA replication and repair protein RadC n=1 Tax=Candidatus Methanoperedens nitratireducens TaxID=1392998 RepID=A0A062V4B1_9EURY|nr:DNA repair protein RadC [Candidatus Methanoperedens nitroreducens]KCZ72187.1 DNA replication and repair protein RadC [Candidatus Methanoperedens nitroreducens]MDJ1421836.1 DNA repair protein RadC [Candidatus Methanoperedens sp.]